MWRIKRRIELYLVAIGLAWGMMWKNPLLFTVWPLIIGMALEVADLLWGLGLIEDIKNKTNRGEGE